MSSIVVVVFDRSRDYELIAHAGASREEANRWLDAQWEALECEPTNPMGKVLVLDRILGIAQYAGEKRFATPGEWAKQYADAVATVLERPVVRVDVANRVVG
jgi:hypothetical protein